MTEQHHIEKKWKLAEFEKIVFKCQDDIAEIAETRKAEITFDFLALQTYAKAILNIREVLCLLYAGFPDGGLSRARNIYEQMVLLYFINKYKDEENGKDIIERYFDDYKIQLHKNRIILYEVLKKEHIACENEYQKLIDEAKKELDIIKQKYGLTKLNEYWWAFRILPNANMYELQKNVQTDLLHVMYKRACISTHASAMGDSALLGRQTLEWNILTTEETFEGFETPILLSMVSFSILTSVVFEYFNIDNPYSEQIKEICQPFWEPAFR